MKFKEPSFSIKLLPDISAIDWQKIMTLRSEVFVGEQKCIYTDPDSEDASAFHTYAVDKTELIQKPCFSIVQFDPLKMQ